MEINTPPVESNNTKLVLGIESAVEHIENGAFSEAINILRNLQKEL